MRKRFLMLALVALFLVFNFASARAQTVVRSTDDETARYEIGGHLFSQNSRDVGFGWGMGGRFTYNLNDYVAFDNEVNFFLPDEGPPYATEGLFGVKVGKRVKKVGAYFKVRPGFQTNLIVNGREQTRFALDVGGVIEIYPGRHGFVRVDASDVIIPFHNEVLGFSPFAQPTGTTHNLLISFGAGVRF